MPKYLPGTAGYRRSSQKMRVENALKEITSNPTLKAAALENLGLSDVAGVGLEVAEGKTLNVSNSITLAGTDDTVMTFPATSATLARTDAANTYTGVQTMTSPVLVTPALGVATGTSLALTGNLSSSAGSIGYATGNGGTVTQLTDRTTGVTLNKLCGNIVTHNASLAAETSAQFTVTNSTVAIDDVVVLSIRSGQNGGMTKAFVNAVAAGSFGIKVANDNAAGGTAETGAIVINYFVLKAVSA